MQCNVNDYEATAACRTEYTTRSKFNRGRKQVDVAGEQTAKYGTERWHPRQSSPQIILENFAANIDAWRLQYRKQLVFRRPDKYWDLT